MAGEEYGYGWLTCVVTTNDFYGKEARRALRYIRASGDDIVHTGLRQDGAKYVNPYISIGYIRYINGIQTNERIRITTRHRHVGSLKDRLQVEQKNYASRVDHFVRFTDEDLRSLPDLPGLMEKAKTFAPPIEAGETQHQLVRVSGEYRKYEGYVFGVVTCTWTYESEGETKRKWVDYLIFPDNTYQQVGDYTGIMEDWIAKQ